MEVKKKRRKIVKLIKILNHQDLNPEFYEQRKIQKTEKKIKFYMERIKS